jgi:hypothetical protein
MNIKEAEIKRNTQVIRCNYYVVVLSGISTKSFWNEMGFLKEFLGIEKLKSHPGTHLFQAYIMT